MAEVKITNEVLHERINHICDKVEDIHNTLHGNGQPGIVQQFNQLKGGVKLFAFLITSGLVTLSVRVFI